MNSSELRAAARKQLQGQYWNVVAAYLILAACASLIYSTVLGFILVGPLAVGFSSYLLVVVRNKVENADIELLLDGFRNSLVTSIVSYLLASLFLILWSLLLIIPGIIKSFSYSMVPYIVADNPKIDAIAAITKSREMMDGNKLRLFKLYFSFIGWYILALLTFGIGFLFLMPYVKTAVTNFYVEMQGPKTLKFDSIEY